MIPPNVYSYSTPVRVLRERIEKAREIAGEAELEKIVGQAYAAGHRCGRMEGYGEAKREDAALDVKLSVGLSEDMRSRGYK